MTRYLVTGALPYSNGPLHVGHIAGAYLPADIYSRFQRLRGAEVRFICGSDDNGVAALKTAREEQRPVEEVTADYRARQHAAFSGLGIEFDIYGGTHSFEPVDPAQPEGQKVYELHEGFAQGFFKAAYENGYFEKTTTQQLYDTEAEQFLPDRYVTGTCPHCGAEGANAGQCEVCSNLIEHSELADPVSALTGTTPELRPTEHWWMSLDSLSPVLERWLSAQPKRGEAEAQAGLPWRPQVVNQALNFATALRPRSMTRDLTWGVPVPLEDPDAEGKSLYVWFDAPIGYVTFTALHGIRQGEGPEAWERWWKDPESKIIHFIGEDNIVFHAVTWPAVIFAGRGSAEALAELDPCALDGSGYQVPAVVVANAYLNLQKKDGSVYKQSKTKGGIFIHDILEHFDPDALRYYLTSVAPETGQTLFNWEDFLTRNNTELVAAFGNFVNRYQRILTKHFDRKVPDGSSLSEETEAFLASLPVAAAEVTELLEGFEFKRGLERAMQLARDCNGYIDQRKPWDRTNPKKELEGKPAGELDLPHAAETLYACVQATRALGILFSPFLPFTGERIRGILGIAPEGWTWSQATTPLPGGHALGEPAFLFKKLEPSDVFDE